MPGRRSPLLVVVTLAAVVLAGCDIDDGRQLADPVFPPPAVTTTTTTPVPDAEIDLPVVSPSSLPLSPELAGSPDGGFQLIAPWRDGAPIPDRYTCQGDAVSPALTWTGLPDGTAEVAVSMASTVDPTDVRWLVLGITPETTGFVEGRLPSGASAWLAPEGAIGYGAPCPVVGQETAFVFTVHALSQQFEPTTESSAADVVASLEIVAIATASVGGNVAG